MIQQELKLAFQKEFDIVGIIDTKRYLIEAKKIGKNVPSVAYPTLVVLGLSYPMRIIKQTQTHLVPSFYTFGSDYHVVLKQRILKVMNNFSYRYTYGVDNHPHDERLAATLAGVGYFGKNQLIINKDYGSYIFLGLVFIDVALENEIILNLDEDCGNCKKCIDACPTYALFDGGYDQSKCISNFNQEKKSLTDEEIKSNYCLFGCDICQLVCPKNIKKGKKIHPEFELSGSELVSIVDLFTNSEKEFKTKYGHMSYMWKGKTILMRNALTIMLKQKNKSYNTFIEDSLMKIEADWYQETALKILEKLRYK